MTCSSTGPGTRLAWSMALSRAARPWPSTGPAYCQPRSSNTTRPGPPPPLAVAGAARRGEPQRVPERGGGVGVLDHVVRALRPRRVAGQAAEGAQVGEVGLAAGEQLVDVGLVAGVPDDPVGRRVEGAVQGDGQLDHAEVGAEVAAAGGDRPDEEVPDLGRQLAELVAIEVTEVAWLADRLEHDCSRICPVAAFSLAAVQGVARWLPWRGWPTSRSACAPPRRG